MSDFQPPPWGMVLSEAAAVQLFREGRAAYFAGKQFHESPYAHAGDQVCSDEDYERGYHWRCGWNQAALAERAHR